MEHVRVAHTLLFNGDRSISFMPVQSYQSPRHTQYTHRKTSAGTPKGSRTLSLRVLMVKQYAPGRTP